MEQSATKLSATSNGQKVIGALKKQKRILVKGVTRTKTFTKSKKKSELQKLQDAFRGYDVEEILLSDPVATREHRSRVDITDIKESLMRGKKHVLITEDVSLQYCII
jgi:ribosomal protein L24